MEIVTSQVFLGLIMEIVTSQVFLGLIMEIVTSQVFAQNLSLGGGILTLITYIIYVMLKITLQNRVVRTNET